MTRLTVTTTVIPTAMSTSNTSYAADIVPIKKAMHNVKMPSRMKFIGDVLRRFSQQKRRITMMKYRTIAIIHIHGFARTKLIVG
jgi:hypothetical protein